MKENKKEVKTLGLMYSQVEVRMGFGGVYLASFFFMHISKVIPGSAV